MIFGNPEHRLGFGASALGGLYDDVPEDAALATVEAAWQMGIRHFDTAPLYGPGLSELRLGDALAGLPRHAYTVSTKVGIRLVPGRPNPLSGAPPRAGPPHPSGRRPPSRAGLQLQPGGDPPLAHREPRTAGPRPRRRPAPP